MTLAAVRPTAVMAVAAVVRDGAGSVVRGGPDRLRLRIERGTDVLTAAGCGHATHLMPGRGDGRVRSHGLCSERKLEHQHTDERSHELAKHRPSL